MDASEQRVAMLALQRGATLDRAREGLRAALGDGAEVGTPDETGIFELRLRAGTFEEALTQVRNAIAAAGADDEVAIAEHPDLPEHWRRRSQSPP